MQLCYRTSPVDGNSVCFEITEELNFGERQPIGSLITHFPKRPSLCNYFPGRL
jgi:hypothetical protein